MTIFLLTANVVCLLSYFFVISAAASDASDYSPRQTFRGETTTFHLPDEEVALIGFWVDKQTTTFHLQFQSNQETLYQESVVYHKRIEWLFIRVSTKEIRLPLQKSIRLDLDQPTLKGKTITVNSTQHMFWQMFVAPQGRSSLYVSATELLTTTTNSPTSTVTNLDGTMVNGKSLNNSSSGNIGNNTITILSVVFTSLAIIIVIIGCVLHSKKRNKGQKIDDSTTATTSATNLGFEDSTTVTTNVASPDVEADRAPQVTKPTIVHLHWQEEQPPTIQSARMDD